MIGKLLGFGALIALSTTAASAANLVTNGGFEMTTQSGSFEFGNSYIYPNAVTGWSSPSTNAFNLYFDAATATSADAATRFPGEQQRLAQLPSLSPNGGNFIALDGDTQFNGAVSQTINGLIANQQYQLTFSWAAAQLSNRMGATTEQLQVGFGGDTVFTSIVANPNQGFTGWFNESFTFTATSASQVLSFLSLGTPNGLPPVALLDGVSVAAVPEPATWGLMIGGFVMVGVASRRRSQRSVAA